ncbi:terminase large subunit [Sulfitobacter sp. 1A16787]|uniref:terminase large subunit n=1 Tax=Sulfitobacter sp. 1A16787 TaxID=3368571 RepID=UPI0037470A0C
MPLDFSCTDWADRLEAGQPPMPDLPVCLGRAHRAAQIFDNLRLPDVPGQPELRQAGAGWFRQIVKYAFGAIDETGAPGVGEVFCLVPKKNGKTTYTAALGITALMLNEIKGAELMIVSATQEIAQTCFSQIVGMIKADRPEDEGEQPYLVQRFDIKEHQSRIVDRWTNAVLKVKTFDMRVVTGSIPLLCIVDELHLLGANTHAERVLTQIRGGMITRPNALLVFITTQSDTPPAGVFKQELDYARRVRDGQEQDTNMLVCLYEFPEAMQIDEARPWADPENWHMVLPNLGRSIDLARLKRLYWKYKGQGPGPFRTWASQHLNVQVGLALHGSRWIGVDHWAMCSRSEIDLAELLERSEVVTAGIDGGGLDDLMALGLIGRDRDTGDWMAWARAWAHDEVLDRRKDIAPRLLDFEADGDLVRCTTPTQDIEDCADLCAQVLDAGLFPEAAGIGLDPYGITALLTELNARGMEGDLLASIGQGTRLSPAVWGLERKLKDQTFLHGGTAMLNWVISNARAEQRGSAVLITKQSSGKAKIDPLISILNAFVLMARNPQAAGALVSPWDDPDYSLTKKGA